MSGFGYICVCVPCMCLVLEDKRISVPVCADVLFRRIWVKLLRDNVVKNDLAKCFKAEAGQTLSCASITPIIITCEKDLTGKINHLVSSYLLIGFPHVRFCVSTGHKNYEQDGQF